VVEKKRMGAQRSPVYEPGRLTAEAVFAAAESLFARHGFERTTMRTIAIEAEVNVGSVYQFFEDKQALLMAITADCLELVDRVFDDARLSLSRPPQLALSPAGKPGPIVTGVVAVIVEGLVGASAKRPMFRTLLGGGTTEGPMLEACEMLRARVEHHVFKLLKSAGHDRKLTRVRRTALICSYTISGLIGRVVTNDGRVSKPVVAELKTVLALYVFHTKSSG
jgi:AcrR family transcriptional regulator